MSFVIFFSVYLIAFSFQTYIIKKRFIDKLDFKHKTRKYFSFVLYLTFFGALLYPLARYFPLVPNWLYFLLSLPIGVIFLTFIITLFHDLISIGFKKSKLSTKRRNFFKKTLDIGATSLILATNLKAMDNARNIELEVVDVKIKNLKKPYKIVQISDIHIGGLIDKDFIKDFKFATYNYKGSGGKCFGFIAQDIVKNPVGKLLLQEHEMDVINKKTREIEGTETTLAFGLADYTSVVAKALQEEIREKDEKIIELESRLEKLENIIKDYESFIKSNKKK